MFQYGTVVWRGFHLRYLVAFALSHLLPRFTAGTLIARLYRCAGFSIGQGSSFVGPVTVLCGAAFEENLVIGKRVLISNNVTINVDAMVSVADDVSIGPFVTIERGVWIGLGATILPGVVLGQGSVIGAGSIVTSNVPPNTYVEGNPAAVVRSLPWGDR